MYKQFQCYNTLKNWKKSRERERERKREREREREIPEEDEKVFLGLWRNWSEAEQTFSLTDKDTVAKAKQSLKAKPKPQRICITVQDFGITFCHRMLIMIWSFILQSSCYFALDFIY